MYGFNERIKSSDKYCPFAIKFTKELKIFFNDPILITFKMIYCHVIDVLRTGTNTEGYLWIILLRNFHY